MVSAAVWTLVLVAGTLCTANNIDIPSIDIDQGMEPGTPADIEDFPGLVQVEVGYGPLWVQGCAGIVMTSHHILSAASCFSGHLYTPYMRRIRAGATMRGRDGVIVEVLRSTNHPSYREEGFEGNLAVVRLASRLEFGPGIQQVPIIGQGVAIPDDLAVKHAGWGTVAQGGHITVTNRQLYSVDLVTTNNAACTELFADFVVSVTVTSNMICAGHPTSGGRTADLRDAGGPLLYGNTLVGVMSFGRYINYDFSETYPVVTTAVGSYTNWIVEQASY